MIEDKQLFVIISPDVRRNAANYLAELPCNGDHEVLFRKVSADKTIKQLSGLFANWVRFLANRDGLSEKDVHRRLKADFLERIYKADPLTPEQEIWCELAAHYQEINDQERLQINNERISLSWSKLKQMKEYMNAIESHYQDKGAPLPLMDRYHSHV